MLTTDIIKFMEEINYNYLIMSQKDLLQNQVIEEILRERANLYALRKKSNDFWIVISPTFIYSPEILSTIKKSNFYYQKKEFISTTTFFKNKNFDFFASLISTDKEFINWFKLRIGYFEEFNNIKQNQKNFVSDGISGVLTSKNKISPLIGNKN